jgi:GNAT superfamily N-acetyltransferase
MSKQTLLSSGHLLELRPVNADDQEFLISVYASTRAEELAQAQWTAVQRDQFVRWQFGLQRDEYARRFPEARHEVILIDDQPAGRIWVGYDAEQIRLLDIALLSEFQNQGAGTALVRQLIDEATGAGKPLRHMVFVLNNDALRFYERLGFELIEDFGAYKHMEYRSKCSAAVI